MNLHTRWQDKADDDRCVAWAKEIHKATEPFSQGVYVNFLSAEGESRLRRLDNILYDSKISIVMKLIADVLSGNNVLSTY